jgi:membrane-associated phospholipid phosphatase
MIQEDFNLKRRHIVFICFLIVMVAIVGVWMIEIMRGEVPYIDKWTRALVGTFQGTYIYSFFRLVTNLGSNSFMYPFTLITSLFLFIIFRDWLPAVTFGLGTYGTYLVNRLIKLLVARERPSILVEANAVGESFPSGHAMIPMVCYGLLAYFLAKKIKSTTVMLSVQIFFSLLVFLIGFSRYVINVHYLTDVVAGFVFGYICLLIIIYLYEWIEYWRTRS